jgi:cytochrome d ubiquinol oxidase subunit II
MVILWWCVLGFLTAGYFALAGYDYGVGMLLGRLSRDEAERRRVLGAFGPFFLANEVWLVAAVGVLFGAFPHLEGKVFSGAYIPVVALLFGLVTFTAAVQLRSRRPDAGRGAWTLAITAGATVTAVSWGVFLGNLVRGLPLDAAGRPTGGVLAVFDPYALLWGAGFVALFALQGAAFLAVRAPAEFTARADRIAKALLAPAFAFLVVAVAWGIWTVVPAVILAFGALAVTWSALRSGRHRTALIATMVLSAAPVLAVGTMRLPAVLTSSVDGGFSLSLTEAATTPEMLGLLSFVLPPALVLIAVVQWVTWRRHHDRVDERSLLHF